nr:hypothetical protein [Kibdelosporangium sp. MJ126-NF4]
MSVGQEELFAAGLRAYVEAVTRALRVEPEAAWWRHPAGSWDARWMLAM